MSWNVRTRAEAITACAASAGGSRRAPRTSTRRSAARPARPARRPSRRRAARRAAAPPRRRSRRPAGNRPARPRHASQTAPPADARESDQRPGAAAGGAGVEVRQVAGDRQQLELERQPERVERRARPSPGQPSSTSRKRASPANARWFGSGSTNSLSTASAPISPTASRCGSPAHRVVGVDDVGAGDGVQLAPPLVQHQRGVGQRLQPRAEPRRGLAHALGDRVHPPALGGVEVEHPVGLGVPDRAAAPRPRSCSYAPSIQGGPSAAISAYTGQVGACAPGR